MLVRSIGTAALLVETENPLVLHEELLRRRAEGQFTALDIVPGARTVLIDGVRQPRLLAEALPGWFPAVVEPTGHRPTTTVEIPVRYTGEDLPDVAELWGCSVEAAVTRLVDTEFTVAFCGFSPGFGYLRGLTGSVPRLATPRPKVPAGAVALAGEYAGIYPTASPGGWRIVGSTDVPLFDVTADPPALLTPGTGVRLVRS